MKKPLTWEQGMARLARKQARLLEKMKKEGTSIIIPNKVKPTPASGADVGRHLEAFKKRLEEYKAGTPRIIIPIKRKDQQ